MNRAEETAPRWLPWLVGAALVLVVVWPWPVHPLQVPGSTAMEADQHLVMLWRAARSLLGDPGPWVSWPAGDPRPVQDLVHVPLMVLLSPFDPALGYGLVMCLDVAIAAAGGWWLSRELGASRLAALSGMAALATAPFLAGTIVFGLSEAWPLGWFALHAAFGLRAVRTERVGWGLAAGLALAAFALSGWYDAVFAGLAQPILVGLAWWRHRPSRRAWVVLLGGYLVAAVLVAPAAVAFLGSGDAAGLAARPTPVFQARPDWRHVGPGGTDPLNLILPTVYRTELTRTVYLGLVTLGLAIVAAVRLPVARWLLAGAAVFAALSLGHHLTFAGSAWVGDTPLPGPGAWLTALVPPLAAIVGWYRAVAIAAVFLAPAAALGVGLLLDGRRRWLAAIPVVAIALDAIVFADPPWPRPTFDPRPPTELAAVPGHGPMLLLPLDDGDRRWPPRAQRPYHRWVPWLGRPVTESYESREAVADEALVRYGQAACARRPGREADEAPPPAPDAARRSAEDLRARGLEAIVVLLPRTPTPTRCLAQLEQVLGPPTQRGEQVVAWRR